MTTKALMAGTMSALSLVAATASEAAVSLRYSTDNGVTFTTVADGGVGDTNAFAGVVAVQVPGMTLSFTSQATQDIVAIPFATFDLTIQSAPNQPGPANLIVEATGTDYLGPVNANFTSSFNITNFQTSSTPTANSIQFTSWFDAGNAAFGKTAQIYQSPISNACSPGSCPPTQQGGVMGMTMGNFSITERIALSVGSNPNIQVQGSTAVRPLPEPATLGLLGAVLAGLGWSGRRRLNA